MNKQMQISNNSEFNVNHLLYDKSQNIYYGNARNLYNKIPYEKITNERIDYYLNLKLFVDTIDGKHNGDFDTLEYHAQRIASLIDLMQNGMILKPIEIFYDSETKEVEIEDGWHRMRASYYLDKNIQFKLYVD